MKNGLIYKLNCKTSRKSYIGKSMEYRFEYRIFQHSLNKSDTHLGRAVKKYGWNDFEVEILEKNIPKDKMSEKEIFYIDKYNTYNEGYNSTIGGEGGNTYSKRSIEQMKETREKISKKLSLNNGNKGQYVGDKNPMYGKTPYNAKNVKLINILNNEEIIFAGYGKLGKYLNLPWKNKTSAVKRIIEKENGIFENYIIKDC